MRIAGIVLRVLACFVAYFCIREVICDVFAAREYAETFSSYGVDFYIMIKGFGTIEFFVSCLILFVVLYTGSVFLLRKAGKKNANTE